MAWARVLGLMLLVLSSSSVALAIEESDRLWTVGERAFEDRLYPLSARALERFIERYGTDRRVPEATLLLGKARLSQGALDAALDAFKRAQAVTPPPGRPGEARFWEAETLVRMGRFADARTAFERVLAEPTSAFAPDALYGLGWADLHLKRPEDAVAEFRRLLSTYPTHATVPSATFYLSRALIELKQPGEAVPLLRGFTTKHPDHRLLPDARYLLGEALLASGESREGVVELRAFASAYPSHELTPQARRAVVDTLLDKGMKTELVDEYRTLVAQAPASAEGLYDAGVIATRLNRPRDAESAWVRLRKEFPAHPLTARASLDLAQAAFNRDAFKDASTLAQAATRSAEEPVRAEALVLLGESELRLKQYPAAMQAFKSAAEAPGQEPALRFRALAGAGLAHEEQRQWREAARYYDEVAAKSPDKTLRAWAKERSAVVAAKLKAPAEKAAPEKAAPGNPASKSQTPQKPASAQKPAKPKSEPNR